MTHQRTLTFLLILALGTVTASAQNLIRNGGFEADARYWLRINAWFTGEKEGPIELDAHAKSPQGGNALRMTDAGIRTPPFVAAPGTELTISAFVRAAAPDQTIVMELSPSLNAKRRTAAPFGAFGGPDVGWRTTVGTEWTRVTWVVTLPDESFKWPAPGIGWLWDRQTWVMFLRTKGAGLWIDGVTVTTDGSGTDAFVPHTPVETLLTGPPNRYRDNGNLFDVDEEVQLRATLIEARATRAARGDVTVRWELFNYDHTLRFYLAEEKLSFAPDAPATIDRTLKLTGRGLLHARVSVLDDSGEVLGSSSLPMTTVPFPKRATKPDLRERIGGTPVIGQREAPHLLKAAQSIGIAWSRWYPYISWKDVQRVGPDEFDWTWPDAALDQLEAHGIANNVVLYGCPRWARAEGSNYIPKDMADWTPDDPRWDDLSIHTLWDKYLMAFVDRYGRGKRAIVYELVNEPEYTGGTAAGGGEQGGPGHRQWDRGFYRKFVERSYKRLKQLDPDGVVLISGVNNAIDTVTKRLLADGGGPYFDVYSYHNYTLTRFSSAESIQGMFVQLERANARPDVKLWFNEGWNVYPSSQDWPAQMMHANRTGADAADISVRNMSECFAAGLDKFIAFNIAYPGFGKSWWDWAGDGTAWWDDDAHPTAAVGAFNVMIHHLGRSRFVRTLGRGGARIDVYHDERNDTGVAVAYFPAADEKKPWAAGRGPGGTILLGGDVHITDLMGNPLPAADPAPPGFTSLTIDRGGKPVYVLPKQPMSGSDFADLLAKEHTP